MESLKFLKVNLTGWSDVLPHEREHALFRSLNKIIGLQRFTVDIFWSGQENPETELELIRHAAVVEHIDVPG
jgi:ABC-type uncharacterized transport system substrate-binding protein